MKSRSIPAAVLSLCAVIAAAGESDPPAAAWLTNTCQIRALTHAQAAASPPVRLRGVVLGESEAGGEGFALHDHTSSIYLRASVGTVSQLHAGDLVEVEGVADPGEFAPFVKVRELRKIGKGPLPEPQRVTFEQIISGRWDAQWVEMSGIVRYYQPGGRKCRIELATGGGRLIVRVNVPRINQPLVDAEVRLRGVCYYQVNKNRQILNPLLSVPQDVPVIVDVPAPADPFATPLRPVGSLLQFAAEGSYGHRVHLNGVVTCQQPGGFVWIRDGNLGLRVQTLETTAYQAGDVVEVVGFPRLGDYSPVLEDGLLKKKSAGPAPIPVRLKSPSEAFDHDANLVELEAVLTEQESAKHGWASILQQDGFAFKALLHLPVDQLPPREWRPGSRVRVAGICSVIHEDVGPSTGIWQPNSFQLLLRSPADLAVIHPPAWWTRERILWFMTAVAGASLLVVVGVLVAARLHLRQQAMQRARAEAEVSAIMAERSRLAREIHDILAQGLSAIFLHLELAKDEFKRLPASIARHLDLAHGLARSSMADARTAVWNLRSQVLENGDLPSAVEGVLKQLAEGSGVEARFTLIGSSRRLAPVIENAVLRTAQEAITNGMKHAKPNRISVELEFAEKHVRLQVADDGHGFDATRPLPRGEGFGLVGMRERATELGGTLTVESASGQGARITLTVPISS